MTIYFNVPSPKLWYGRFHHLDIPRCLATPIESPEIWLSGNVGPFLRMPYLLRALLLLSITSSNACSSFISLPLASLSPSIPSQHLMRPTAKLKAGSLPPLRLSSSATLLLRCFPKRFLGKMPIWLTPNAGSSWI